MKVRMSHHSKLAACVDLEALQVTTLADPAMWESVKTKVTKKPREIREGERRKEEGGEERRRGDILDEQAIRVHVVNVLGVISGGV